MSDGHFAMQVSKDRNDNAVDNPIIVQLSDGSAALGITGGALDVNVANTSIAVTQSGTWDIGTVTSITNDVNIADGGNSITVDDGGSSLTVDGTVAISGTVTVDATDLDIRDLAYTQDSIQIWANTAKDGTGTNYIPVVDSDGQLQVDVLSLPATTVASDKVDDSAFIVGTDSVGVAGFLADEASPDSVDEGDVGAARMTLDRKQLMVIADPDTDANRLAIDANGYITVNVNGTVTVSATDLDIRDITDTSDKIAIGDGTDTLDINADGSINITDNGGSLTVDATDLDIRALDHVTIGDSVRVGDGTETWSIDASGYGQVDIAAQSLTAIKVSKDANANSETNPIYVHNVDTIVSGVEVHDYDQAVDVTAGSTANHDYAVTGTTMLLKSIIVSASGNAKFEVQVGPSASLATVAVGFLNGRQGDTKQITFDPPIEVPATGTGTVRVIKTNRQLAAQDIYSTIIGSDV